MTPLVVCCGNPLRGDDAVAWALAERLTAEDAGSRIETCHALTPELAPVVAAAATVIFLDARVGDCPGQVSCGRLYAQTFTAPRHGETPEGILALARDLYAATPDAFLVTITARQFAFGAPLSPEVAEAVPEALARIRDLAARAKAKNPRSVPASLTARNMQ